MASFETILETVTKSYLEQIADDATLTMSHIRDALIGNLNLAFMEENTRREGKNRFDPIKVLHEICITRVLLARFRIVTIDMTSGRGREAAADGLLTIYEESGALAGLYNADSTRLKALVSNLSPAQSAKSIGTILERMQIHAPVVHRTIEPHLIPVVNGVFDHVRQELKAFRPEWVFLSKIQTEYDPHAESPIITNEDMTTWEVEAWMHTLSDDEDVPELLWEIVSAATRPHVAWHKSAFLMGPAGMGGKGTLLALMRSLVGPGSYASVPLVDFADRFAKVDLISASVNLVDENDVGAYAMNLGPWKACVTGDSFGLEAKFKNRVVMIWSGFEVQCLNTMTPEIKDKSASIKRRLLFVPMTKNFIGTENKDIKLKHLTDPAVLRYVLKRALTMTHTELSNPKVCQEALDQWYGSNNKIVGFFEEHEKDFKWGLLPWGFLHQFYAAWLRKTEPASTPIGKIKFVQELKTLVAKSLRWEVGAEQVPGSLMDAAEPFIGEYDLKDWMDPSYTGSDPEKQNRPVLKHNYSGLVRKP